MPRLRPCGPYSLPAAAVRAAFVALPDGICYTFYRDFGKKNGGRCPAGKRNHAMKKLLVRLFCLVCAAGLVFSLWNIWTILSEYREGDRMYESAASQYVSSQPEQQAETDPNKVPIQVDFDHLKAQNPDVVGWLYCEGTPINYPVMQGRTNDDYLYTMLDGSYNKAGSLFLDCAADPGFQDPAPVIYGHSMKNDSMFGTLHDFSKQEYYDAHPVMWLLTPEKNWRLDLIAGYVTVDTDQVYQKLGSVEALQTYLSSVMRKSSFAANTTVDVSKVERAVFLSTCSYETENSRYILVGIPVEVNG